MLPRPVRARENFWYGLNFRGFNFRSAIGDRKLNPVENNRLYGMYQCSLTAATQSNLYFNVNEVEDII